MNRCYAGDGTPNHALNEFAEVSSPISTVGEWWNLVSDNCFIEELTAGLSVTGQRGEFASMGIIKLGHATRKSKLAEIAFGSPLSNADHVKSRAEKVKRIHPKKFMAHSVDSLILCGRDAEASILFVFVVVGRKAKGNCESTSLLVATVEW